MMQLPLWSIAPFVCVVLCLGLLPPMAPIFWKKYRGLILATFAMPTLSLSGAYNFHWVTNAFADYVSFICLLGTLYAIGGGLYVHGAPKASPATNLGYMALGAVLASFIGTLGASMLLVRPLLRSNRGRKTETHVVVFFIFIVSNVGGLLTPLGNPPLLFGFLLGVPFWWSLKLFAIWFFAVTSLLGLFAALDSFFYIRDPDFRGPMKQDIKANFKIVGRWNLALIPLVIAGLILPKAIPNDFRLWQDVTRVAILLFVIALSRRVTPKQVDSLNNFSWEPLIEVAIVFAAIFATMIPAIKYLEAHAEIVGLNSTWSFFWFSGLVSSIFNNAPTYAAFFAIAQGLGKDFAMLKLSNGSAISEPLLIALSCGSVMFGALTYLGNGPNLLIKGVADDEKVKMPSFFGYIVWSVAFLLPILFLTAVLFFEY